MKSEGSYSWVIQSEADQYSAKMTGNPFMFRETRILCGLIMDGIDREQIVSDVTKKNLFQYRSSKSIPKRVNALLSRLSGVPIQIVQFVSSSPIDEARLVLLLLNAVHDRLFREFLMELVMPLSSSYDPKLSRATIERFFELKTLVSPKVAGWSTKTRTKLRAVYESGLTVVGILKDNKRLTYIQRPVLTPTTNEFISVWFPPEYRMIFQRGS